MGAYIEKVGGVTLPEIGKADWLINNAGALPIVEPEEWIDGIVCVVENRRGPGYNFDAAGYADTPEELQRFKRPDSGPQRKRTWLFVPNARQYTKLAKP